MATYVFRSNIAVTPPPGVSLPFLTANGIATGAVGEYLAGLQANGHAPTPAQASAFMAFHKTLDDAGLWDKIIEAYPLFGSTESARVKLKYLPSAGKMLIPHNGWTGAAFEAINGLVVGKGSTAYVGTSAPCLRTGLRVRDLARSFGLVAHVGGIPVHPTSEGNRQLWGASQIESADASTSVSIMNESPTSRGAALANGFVSGRTVLAAYDPTSPHYLCARTAPGGFAVRPGIGQAEVTRTGLTSNSADGQDRECFLFARNGVGANADVTGSFPPKIRLVLITAGISAAEGETIMAAANALQTALGRQF